MSRISPLSFWELYRGKLCALGSWDAYQSSAKWTKIAVQAADGACKDLGLEVDCEYLRLDVCGWEKRHATDPYDWSMRIAFEAENGARWKDELCKLSHIVCDLCVLAIYETHATWTASEALEEYLHRMRDRVSRVSGRQWLFIIGPHADKLFAPWQTLTFDGTHRLIPLKGAALLHGSDLDA